MHALCDPFAMTEDDSYIVQIRHCASVRDASQVCCVTCVRDDSRLWRAHCRPWFFSLASFPLHCSRRTTSSAQTTSPKPLHMQSFSVLSYVYPLVLVEPAVFSTVFATRSTRSNCSFGAYPFVFFSTRHQVTRSFEFLNVLLQDVTFILVAPQHSRFAYATATSRSFLLGITPYTASCWVTHLPVWRPAIWRLSSYGYWKIFIHTAPALCRQPNCLARRQCAVAALETQRYAAFVRTSTPWRLATALILLTVPF